MGRVENMPDGGVGDGPGSIAEPPQATTTAIASAPAVILKSGPSAPRPVFPSNIPSFTPVRLSVKARSCLPTLLICWA